MSSKVQEKVVESFKEKDSSIQDLGKSLELPKVLPNESWNSFIGRIYSSYSNKKKNDIIKAYWSNKKSKTLTLNEIIIVDMAHRNLHDNLKTNIFNGEDSDDINDIISGILDGGEDLYNKILKSSFAGKDTDNNIDKLMYLCDEESGYFIHDLYETKGFDPVKYR